MFTGLDAVTVIPRRRWTAVASFSVQAAVVAAALVLPLLRPTDLPEAFTHHRIFVPYSQPETPATPANPHPPVGHWHRGPSGSADHRESRNPGSFWPGKTQCWAHGRPSNSAVLEPWCSVGTWGGPIWGGSR